MDSVEREGAREQVAPDAVPIEVHADIATTLTYASFQNAIPVIRSISIKNSTGRPLENCRIELVSAPPFLRSKVWTVDRIAVGDTLTLGDRRVELDARYLAGLNEAERGEISLNLSTNGEIIAQQHLPVRLLARDEWGGVGDMAQLLPAFVLPNDPTVAGILRAAADRLAAHGHPSGLDGYQSANPARAFLLAGAIYSAVAGLGLHYAEPPASFEQRGQKVRLPGVVAADRLATCLDTALLFAAALEAAGLNPLLLLFRDHAATGVWLTKRMQSNAIEPDLMEVRKALAGRELIVFETTGVTHRPPLVFQHAQQVLTPRLEGELATGFVAAIDVSRSRGNGITPLASHEPSRSGADETDAPTADLPLPAVPDAGLLPPEPLEIKPTTAAGRIDRWQKKLLDLTLRNRLLNFPDSKKTIPFLCTDLPHLEDRLAGGATIRLVSLPEQNPHGGRDPSLYRELKGRDLDRGFAAEALARDELASSLDQKALEARLIELHRQVKNDFAEGGANTLFLAVGFLRWKRKPGDERSYRGPLLLVPVKLDRRSATSQFNLRFHEDEPRFNATLLQFLEREFGLSLPQFAGDLPRDGSGIDVLRILDAMRQAVREVQGMEVVDEAALSTFSFAKFLMWKDLVERTDALRQNRVVRHLIDTPEQAFPGGDGVFRDERDLDRHYAPADIVSLLPADSSQVAASMAAAEGRDFVIVGPPGTGKSQTIANMIANCLAVGRTVLFVAEKTAALDVVHRRLREHGLGEHCLELHSSKADRRGFIAQLRRSWEKGGRGTPSEWITINEKLKIRRDLLNAYVAALHRQATNGLSPYAALGVALRGRERYAPELAWPSIDAHDAARLREIEDLAAEIGRTFAVVERRPAVAHIDVPDWSQAWQEELLKAADDLRRRSRDHRTVLAAFLGAVDLEGKDDASWIEIERFGTLAATLRETEGTDRQIAFDREFPHLDGALVELEGMIAAYRDAEGGLTARFTRDAVARVPVAEIEDEWHKAAASIWPLRSFAQQRVRRRLKSHAESGTPAPERDLPRLRRMQESRSAIEASRLAGRAADFRGLDTDVAAVRRQLAHATRLRESLLHLGRTADDVRRIALAIAPVLHGRAPASPVHMAAVEYHESFSALRDGMTRFAAAAGGAATTWSGESSLEEMASAMDALVEARHLLRNWASWCRVRQKGMAHGLGPLVADLERGAIEPAGTLEAFRLAYARWWLPPKLDADPVLRDFRRFQHEHAITEFRDIDDMVRAQAATRVVSAIAHDLPSASGVGRNSELGLLRHQMELQRPSRSIRDMIGAMPSSFSKLAPCMLMSPLSIAQYLPPNQALFDVVIFDEASQITTWDAVGAIARGRQTIIVGDPRQLPPTNFFGRNEEDEEIAEHERDLESILDEAKAAGIPVRDLRWHYRSRHESLIAFSNAHYYQNRLITFPSPVVDDRAVRLRRVPDGIYDRGKSRTNRIEAKTLVEDAVRRLRAWLKLEEHSRPTLGIITFNSQQQTLIQDLLDDARRIEPELEWFFAEERIEPAIVKNLENVQGDERDVILFSITFGKDAAGKRTMDFGALNRDGGERRLNVAVTRARQELVVFSGFTADQIDGDRTKALGVHHLKTFLDFADRGAIALSARDEGSQGPADSPFEEAVAAELERLGWQTIPQVGISGFRIDIGIRHPDLAGAYLAGIECDGATYHSAATARDRDKVREQVLRGLGWNILRVWSTDWWFEPAGAIQRLHGALNGLLELSRESRAAPETAEGTVHWDMGHEIDPSQSVAEPEDATEASPDAPSAGNEEDGAADEWTGEPAADPAAGTGKTLDPAMDVRLTGHAGTGTARPSPSYAVTDLSSFAAAPDRFHDDDYRQTLQAMIDAVLACEAPLREEILCQRIARAHGWLRTGGRIRERIMMHLRHVDRTEESSGAFVWSRGTVVEVLPYRASADPAAGRAIPDIPLAELASILLDSQDLLDKEDPALAFARLLGVGRLAAAARARLEEAITRVTSRIGPESRGSTVEGFDDAIV